MASPAFSPVEDCWSSWPTHQIICVIWVITVSVPYIKGIKWCYIYDTNCWIACRKIPRRQRSHVLSPRHGFSILRYQKCFEPEPQPRLDSLLFLFGVQVSDIMWPKNLDFSPHDDPGMKLTERLVIIYNTYWLLTLFVYNIVQNKSNTHSHVTFA